MLDMALITAPDKRDPALMAAKLERSPAAS